MAESLPSKKITVADVPEVESFTADFFYNFFTPDEKVNSSGTVPKKILERPSEKFDTKFVDSVDFNRSVPRYVEFHWKPVNVGNRENLTAISIEQNYKKIHYEDDFSLNDYTLLTVQDTNVDQRMEFFVRKAIQNLQNFQTSKEQSMQESLKMLNTESDSDISSEFLELGLSPQSVGSNFFDADGNQIKSNILESLKKVQTKISINNKVLSDIVQISAYDDALSPLADELADFIQQASSIQTTAEKSRDSSLVSADQYDFEVNDYILQKAIDADKFDSVLQTIGYIIEKEEVNSDNTITTLPPIFIESPTVSTTVDVRLKYGSTYNYRIRTVAYVELQAVEETLGIVAAIGFLMASKATPTAAVDCSEFLPPPAAADFDPRWDYKKNQLQLNWSFPVNPQQDIKKFQVFRRKTINEPFQLIKMYNFDDSAIPTDDNERPYNELVQVLKFPLTTYCDVEFTKNSKYIYAICSIDAHGMSSGYSTQWEISFDRSKNKLIKKLISISGAPKAYPNAYLNTDTFIDTIKDEWHSKIRIYFDPEYLRVYDKDNNDLKLIRAKNTDKYVLQLINIDLQKESLVEIQIQDLTTNQRLSINNKKVYPINPDIIESSPPKERQTDNNGRWSTTTAANSFKIGSQS